MMRLFLVYLILGCSLLGFTPSAFADLSIKEWTTPKNIHIIFVSDTSNQLISVNFAFKGVGSRTDPSGKEGLVALMNDLLFLRSTEGSNRYILDKKLKSLGVLYGIQSSVDADNINFWFKCPKQKLKEVFDIIKIVITNPDFDSKELEKSKHFDPSGSRLATAGEQEFASKVLIQKLLAPHPYAIPSVGTLEGRQTITIQDIQTAAKDRFAKDVLVFSIIGDVTPNSLTNFIDNTFGSLPEKAKIPNIHAANINANSEVIFIPKDSPQSGVVFAQPGIASQHPDYLPLLIVNDILGAKAFTSRLWIEAREKQGLVYSIQTDIYHWQHASLLMGGFETSNENVEKVIDLVRQQWKLLKEKGISEAEFKAAKTSIKGNFVLKFASPDGIAQYLLYCYLNQIPTNYINQRNQLLDKVTLEDVNRVAKSLFDPEKLSFAVVGNVTGSGLTKQ